MKPAQLLSIAMVVIGFVAGYLAYSSRRADPEEEAPSAVEEEVLPEQEGAPVGRVAVPGATSATSRTGRWNELNNAGVEALERGELERARELFERALEGKPEDAVFRGNLAEALARLAIEAYSQGDQVESALALLTRAVALAPEREDLARTLERWRSIAAAEEDFWEYQSTHFDLSFDASRTDLLYGAQDVLDELEEAYTEFGSWFRSDPVEEGRARIRVVLHRREGFGDLTGLGDWAGGLFDGSVRMPLDDLKRERSQWVRVLRHELVHVFVHHRVGSDTPGWFNEGLAQLLEGDPAALLAYARERTRGHEPFPLEELEGSLIGWSDAELIRRAYAQSLLITNHVRRYYGDSVLLAMLLGVQEPGGVAQAFQRATGVSLATAIEDEAAGR